MNMVDFKSGTALNSLEILMIYAEGVRNATSRKV
jgi:hypothetical protein